VLVQNLDRQTIGYSVSPLYAEVVAECIHGLRHTSCQQCATPPSGINDIVYVTKGGAAFHNRKDCTWLVKGQHFAEYKGQAIHPIESTPWSEATQTHVKCTYCCHPS
jgi:hypothetical protein